LCLGEWEGGCGYGDEEEGEKEHHYGWIIRERGGNVSVPSFF
jgi:hypothetical protein